MKWNGKLENLSYALEYPLNLLISKNKISLDVCMVEQKRLSGETSTSKGDGEMSTVNKNAYYFA